MYVDTDFSRSNIASTYPALTAPASTKISPASRIASSLLPAVPGTLICANVKISLTLHRLLHQQRSTTTTTATTVKHGPRRDPPTLPRPKLPGPRPPGPVPGPVLPGPGWSRGQVGGGSGGGGSVVGGAVLGFGDPQLLHDRVVLRAVHEVVDRHMLRARRHRLRPRRQILMRHHQVDVIGQVRDRHVHHTHIGEPGLLDLVPQHRRAHRARPHPRITREHNMVDRRPPRLRRRPPALTTALTTVGAALTTVLARILAVGAGQHPRH